MKERPFVILVLALVLCAQQMAAAPITDAAGDFLATYAGPQNGDLDVIASEVVYDAVAHTLAFSAELGGPVGTTANALYVWGLDRGTGSELFLAGTPSIGAGGFFDAVFVASPTLGAGIVNLLDGSPNQVLPGILQISGNTLSTVIDAALLPSTGAAFADYSWNLWPRLGTADNTQISDFAPDTGAVPGVSTNAPVTVVPEPTSLGLVSLGLIGLAARRRIGARP